MQSEAGTLLVEGGLVSEAQLQRALTASVNSGGGLVQNLIQLGATTGDRVAAFFASRLQLPLAQPSQFDNLPAFITRLLPIDVVMNHRTVPLMLHQGVLHMAISDPTNRAALEEISFITGYSASAVAAADELIEAAMARYYDIPPDGQTPVVEPAPGGGDEPLGQSLRSAPAHPSGRDAFAAGPPLDEEPGPAAPPSEPPESAAPGENPAASGSREDAAESEAAVVVEPASGELAELFGLDREREIIHLTRPKRVVQVANSISDAIRQQVTPESAATTDQPAPGSEERPAPEPEQPASSTEQPAPLPEQPAPLPEQPAPLPEQPAAGETPSTRPQAATAAATDDGPAPLGDAELARNLIAEADDRDAVARALLGYARTKLARVVLFIVRKDLLVGWMGAGQDIDPKQIKGIMIPLSSPSVFRTVRETGTDYFGDLPRTTVNDIFLSALGDLRPRQVLLIPITVRHKPICVLYGDCGTAAGFTQDLSGIHLMAQDAANAFEQLILQRKMGRLVKR